MHSAAAPGGSVLPGAQDLSRRAARCAPACRPGSPPADRETQGGGERRWPGASAPTRSSIQRGMHLGSTPWSSGSARLRVRLCGAPAGEGGSRRCVHHTLPDVSGRFTRACRSDHFKATLNKNEPFNSWPPSIRPSLRSLPLLSFSLSLSLSFSLESLSLSLSSLSTAALSVCRFFPLSLSSLYRFSVSLTRARARSLSSLFFRFLLSGLLSLFSLPTSISLFFPPAPPLVFSFSLSFL